jgi:hypothetical protein
MEIKKIIQNLAKGVNERACAREIPCKVVDKKKKTGILPVFKNSTLFLN